MNCKQAGDRPSHDATGISRVKPQVTLQGIATDTKKHIPSMPQFFHLVDGHSKDEYVLGAHFLTHLNVGTIKCANRESTVELQVRKDLWVSPARTALRQPAVQQ